MFVTQNCSDVNLQLVSDVDFMSLSKNPFRLDPPIDVSQPRRIVLLVDMSNSMITGSCPQDVDAGILFPGTGTFVEWDPNKSTGSPLDHRADGIDCRLDRGLAINRNSILNPPVIDASQSPLPWYSTHLGIDYERDRLGLLKNWIVQLRANPSAVLADTKLMIVPVSGGISQKKMNSIVTSITGNTSAYKFVLASDAKIDRIVDALIAEHDRNLDVADDQDEYRYENRTMGTTALGQILKDIYLAVNDDMKSLLPLNTLAFSQYQVIHISDGKLTPIKAQITSTLQFYGQCSACAGDPSTCTGNCTTLAGRLTDAWGVPDDNDLAKLDYNFSVLQGMPSILGGGFLQVDFVQLKPARFATIYPAGEKPYFSDLQNTFESRHVHYAVWPSSDTTPPFKFLGDASVPVSYKVTHLYLLNGNARLDVNGKAQVDSDGDGMFDVDEIAAGTNQQVQRTYGYCLDSIYNDPAFKARCQAMAASQTCDAQFDADRDGLNECEESILATNPADFDTDDDGIPDSFEWLYGYNSLSSDVALDSNSDGFLNGIAFSSGAGPQHDLRVVSPGNLMQYKVNSKGYEVLNISNRQPITVELYELLLRNMTVGNGRVVPPSQIPRMRTVKWSTDTALQTPYDQQLLSVITVNKQNTLIGLARMIDQANPGRAYWRFFKRSVPNTNVYTQPIIDLSNFKLLPASDRIN